MIRVLVLLAVLSPLAFAQTNPANQVNIDSRDFEVTSEGLNILKGDVSIEIPDMFLITADQAIHDINQQTVRAIGNVKIDYETTQGLVEVTAGEVFYDLVNHSGTLYQVTAQFGDSFFFSGESLEILNQGENFIIQKGVATSCNQPTPQWSLKVRKATIEKEGYAHIRAARFKIKNLPLIHIPYLILPAMQKRRSGVLTPDTGRSERNGAFFKQPIYWAPRQDLDFTFEPTWFEKSGFKLDLEARYRPNFNLSGQLNGTVFKDKVIEELEEAARPVEDGKAIKPERFRIKWEHDQKAMGGHMEVRVDAGSDFSVDRDFLRSTEPTRIRDYFYRARYDRAYGRNMMIVEANLRQRILAINEEVTGASHLPEVRFYQPNRHLGNGFYLRNYFYSSYYDLEDLGAEMQFDGNLMRAGVDSELSRAGNLGRFFHTRYGVGYQGAFYYQNNLTDPLQSDLNLERNGVKGGAFGFLETVGPRLQKSYRIGDRKLIHYVDAILLMQLGAREEDPFLEAVLLDELDIRIDDQVKGFRTAWRINSRFFTKDASSIKPVFELELSQDVDLEEDEESEEPINARFRLLNVGGFHANGIFEYNPNRGTLDTLSIYSSVNWGNWRGYGGYVRRNSETLLDRESFIGISRLQLPQFRSALKLALDYDFEQSDFKSQEFAYTYQGQCLAVALSYVKSPFDSRDDRNRDFFQITFSLTNLGDLGTKL